MNDFDRAEEEEYRSRFQDIPFADFELDPALLAEFQAIQRTPGGAWTPEVHQRHAELANLLSGEDLEDLPF